MRERTVSLETTGLLRNVRSAEEQQNGVAGRRHEARANTFLKLGT